MKKHILAVYLILFACSAPLAAQEDLLSMLEEEPTTEYVNAAFKTNRVINLHSVENTAAGVMDFKISHRFGFVNGGIKELFGLDNASIRFGFEFGLTPRLQVGLGRSSFEKTYDGYFKYKILRQKKGEKNLPITMSVLGSTAIKTTQWPNPDRENYFSSRLYYNWQLIVGSKLSEKISVQLVPGVVHRNLVRTREESNDVYNIGFGGRVKLSKRIAINAEYIYVLPDQLAPGYRNSLSIGIDLETGGHVFQLHFTNSTSMIEKGYITETVGNWADGGVHFGFNVSRVFTVFQPKKKME